MTNNVSYKQRNYQFNPLLKPRQLICGTGRTAIVTGWTVKEAIAKKLQPQDFAVIGQLYSPTRGISFLVRNLLANPHVNCLIIVDGTKEDSNAGGCQCLKDFFDYGFTKGVSDTGRDCWIINSSITGYIDIQISAEALEQLRETIKCYQVLSITAAVDKAQSERLHTPVRERSLEFPLPEIIPTVFPGSRYGHRIEGKTVAETWVKIIQRIKTTGTIRPTGYDGYWQELINLMAIVTDEPPGFYFPDPNYLPCDRPFIEKYIPQVLDDAPYIEGVKYSYGQRLRSWFGCDQIEQVIQKLIGEIDAASAVMSLWDVKDHEKGGSPCLNHVWLRVVENELSLTALFRSNDMYMAWVSNAMGLRALQQYMRDEIASRSEYDLKMGPLITISQSAHIYDDCWENADQLIEKQYAEIVGRRDYDDPVGNFLVEVEGKNIVVKHTTPGSGEIIAEYSASKPLLLIRQICAISHLDPCHAAYLGIEIQKAANSLVNGNEYIQDR